MPPPKLCRLFFYKGSGLTSDDLSSHQQFHFWFCICFVCCPVSWATASGMNCIISSDPVETLSAPSRTLDLRAPISSRRIKYELRPMVGPTNEPSALGGTGGNRTLVRNQIQLPSTCVLKNRGELLTPRRGRGRLSLRLHHLILRFRNRPQN